MSFKTICCSTLICSMSMFIYAKTAKDIADSMFSKLQKQSNISYTCNGDDKNTTCTAKYIPIEEISLNNVVLNVVSSNNSYKIKTHFDVGYPKDLGIYDEIRLDKVNCDISYTARGIVLNSDITCNALSPSYSFKIKNITDIESKSFSNKDIATIFDEFEDIEDSMPIIQDSIDEYYTKFLNKYGINIKEFYFELKGNKLGDKIFKIIKYNDSEYTKEQYIASVNMGVSMVPVSLANEKSISQNAITQLSKLATAVGDLLTSKKQYVSVRFTKKTNSVLNSHDLIKIFDEPLNLFKYIDEYNISIISR